MKHTTKALSILLDLLMIFSVNATAAVGNGGGNAALTLVSAKVGDADLEGAKIPAGSEIVLTFSNNVTDESVLANNVGKIKVMQGEATKDSTVSASGNNAFIVKLGSLSKGEYTLTVGKELKAKNGNTLGTKVEIAFQVNKGDGSGSGTGTGGGNNPLSFVSAKADGKDLEGATLAASGSITVTFDRGMTENQAANFEQIGILDKDGKKVDGVTFSDFTKDDDGNSYTVVSYKDLADGAYTLKLGKDLKANNGNTLGKAVNISFTVKGADNGDSGKDNKVSSWIDAFLKLFNAILDFFKKLIK